MTILDTIVARKKEEVARLLRHGLREPECEVGPPRPFAAALVADGPAAIIGEAKKASPSKGLIRPDFDPCRIARWYAAGGASAMSVLTDEAFFQGALAYLAQVRGEVDLPLLRKDFLIHEIQIREAVLWGADAVLFIVAILDPVQLRDFLQLAAELGLDALTEVHDEAEVETALAAGARLIGVNNRNLRTFDVDMTTTFRLQERVPAEIPLVSESGIRDEADMRRLAEAGVTAALIGETLMRAADPAEALARLRAAGREIG